VLGVAEKIQDSSVEKTKQLLIDSVWYRFSNVVYDEAMYFERDA